MAKKIICGVYQILCVPTGKVYVGSSKDIQRRWRHHRGALNNRCHGNEYLQRSWDKYGKGAFTFCVLERTKLNGRIECENWWIDFLDCYTPKGYNLAAPENQHMCGETRLKISMSNRGEGHGCSKLTEKDVLDIYERIQRGENGTEIAQNYNVTRSTIYTIWHGRGWKHLFDQLDKPLPRSPMATKLTATDAQEIRQQLVAGIRQVDLAAVYGISDSGISDIKRGKAWKDAGGLILPFCAGSSKLTYEKISEIKQLLRTTTKSQEELARMFNVSRATIGLINHGKAHSDVGGLPPRRPRVSPKLSFGDVQEIRALLQRRVPQKEIGEKFGIAAGTVSQIKTGKIHSAIGY